MRQLLIALIALTGCGSVDVIPDPPSASKRPCMTSFGCPVGERCDDGKCLADVGCPEPAAPRILYTSPDAAAFPLVVTTTGREYLMQVPHYEAAPTTDLPFLDLMSGATSVLHHAPGYANCELDLALCSVTTNEGAISALLGLSLDEATGAWSAASIRDFPSGYALQHGKLPGGELVLSGLAKPDVRTFNLSTGESSSLFETGGRALQWVLARPSGPTLMAYAQAPKSGTTFSAAPVLPGATWAAILELPDAFQSSGFTIPSGNDWFIVADASPSKTQHVWRVSATSTQDVGESAEPLLAEIAIRVATGATVLDGTVGKGLVCPNGICQSGTVDLATLTRTSIGSVTLPGVTRSEVVQQRWLSCDAVEAIVEEPIFGAVDPKANATGYRIYSVRVPGVVP